MAAASDRPSPRRSPTPTRTSSSPPAIRRGPRRIWHGGTCPGLRVEPVVADALGSASVIILATPSVRDDAGIRALAASLGDVSGKVVIDATNPLGSFGESLNVRWGGDGTSGGEVLASALPGARVYKRPQTRSASSTCGPPWGRT